mgnify:FL=1|jgi:hypothetical protein
MALSYLTDINLNKNELQNAVIQKVGTDPSSGLTAGWLIYNTASNQLKVYDGSDWANVGGDITRVNITAGTGLSGTLDTQSGAHTQTIDLANTAVTAGSYGSATAIPTFTVDAQGRLTAAGTVSITTSLTIDSDSASQDVSLADDDLKIVGTANEIETAVTKSGTDVSLTIGLPDDVTIGNDLTVLGDLQVTGTTTTNNVETVSTSNGIIFEGTVADAHEGTLLAGALTADVTYTLPDKTGTVAMTSDITDRFYATSIGDGSATSYAVTHNLGSQDVIVQLYDASSLDTVFADVVRTSTSVVTIDFNSAPTANDIRVLVTKIG